MDFVSFPVGTTNIFPLANSTVGGQLLSEWNIRSRESVGTPSSVQYMIGPSYTHNQDDFYVVYYMNKIEDGHDGASLSTSQLRIEPGRALINGHFVQTLAPMVIDLAEANARLQKFGKDPLKGDLAIGIRAMYATEVTVAGTMKVENEDNYYEGLHVVVLPANELKCPVDVPSEEGKVNCHLKLATFTFKNGKIYNLKQNESKIQIYSGERIGDIDEMLSSVYLKKYGLQPKRLYTFAGKGTDPNTGKDTWCDSTDSLMIWDKYPKLTDGEAKYNCSDQAQFTYNALDDTVELLVPHKQVDGMVSQTGQPQYYPDRHIQFPKADYSRGTGGAVTRDYTRQIKLIQQEVQRYYSIGNGRMRMFIDTLTDKSTELPDVSKTNWSSGDYVLVGQDATIQSGGDQYPSTMYVVVPGIITKVTNQGLPNGGKVSINKADIQSSTSWEDAIKGIIAGADWRTRLSSIVEAMEDGEDVSSTVVEQAINRALFECFLEFDIDWKTVIKNEQETKGGVENIPWSSILSSAFDAGMAEFSAKVAEYAADIASNTSPSNPSRYKLVELTDGMYKGDTARISDEDIQKWTQHYTAVNWADVIGRSIKETLDRRNRDTGKRTNEQTTSDYSEMVGYGISTSAANEDRSTINWKRILKENVDSAISGDNIDWNQVIADAIAEHSESYEQAKAAKIKATIPSVLASGMCIADKEWEVTPTDESVMSELGIIPDPPYGTLRGTLNKDYIRITVIKETTVECYYFKVSATTGLGFPENPILITGTIAYATESSIGGFLNASDSDVGHGYVYRNDEGYLQLVDYDLLYSGVLAYQLGSDYTVQAESFEDIQIELDEYINNRVAFLTSEYSGDYSPVVNLYIDLPTDNDAAGTIKITGIDSRFNTYVYIHITGGNSSTVVNISDCEKIRLDLASMSNATQLNIYRCGLYYDADCMNRISNIYDFNMWYEQFSEDDSDIVVDGMTVRLLSYPESITTNDDYWSEDVANDNHYSYALHSITFDNKGSIIGCGLLVASGSTTNVMDEGKYISSKSFTLPQGVGLHYPVSRVDKKLKVTGSFISAYPDGSDYRVEDISFTAITNTYSVYQTSVGISGTITFYIDVNVIENKFGLSSGQSIDAWEPNKFHLFYGGTTE